MNADVQALLDLQGDDSVIRELENKAAALEPKLADLDRRREIAATALARARGAVESEEKRQRELQARVAQHKQIQERNLAQLDAVKKMKEATAAMAQVESARRMIAEDESEITTISRRISELQNNVKSAETALAEVEAEQATARSEIVGEREKIDGELKEARGIRAKKSQNVNKSLLSKYDRIRTRRPNALYPLNGQACGNCDTSIPLQRRNVMAGDGAIEVCEACGVLLYR
jgi:predicted  nucleic acid-binding Zn-ribbon protein